MKKSMLLCVLLLMTAAGFAQESRQDVSLSLMGVTQPQVFGNAVQQTPTSTLGGLASYRYMLTPSSALEVNYSFAQYSEKYYTTAITGRFYTRQQEISAAYVRYFNFKNFNPFLEAGIGGIIFTPINDFRTTFLDAKQTTDIGAIYGGGIAYEISPSFDVRVEYRGLVVKSPYFNVGTFKTNTYTNISVPVLGIAYHF
jgi:opacity protein-like surface antigen